MTTCAIDAIVKNVVLITAIVTFGWILVTFIRGVRGLPT